MDTFGASGNTSALFLLGTSVMFGCLAGILPLCTSGKLAGMQVWPLQLSGTGINQQLRFQSVVHCNILAELSWVTSSSCSEFAESFG